MVLAFRHREGAQRRGQALGGKHRQDGGIEAAGQAGDDLDVGGEMAVDGGAEGLGEPRVGVGLRDRVGRRTRCR